jgi:hypothetical protein
MDKGCDMPPDNVREDLSMARIDVLHATTIGDDPVLAGLDASRRPNDVDGRNQGGGPAGARAVVMYVGRESTIMHLRSDR